MKVLFFMRSTVYVRNFESTLRLLAERGHEVEVVAEPHRLLDPTNLIGRLSSELPTIRHSAPPVPASGSWAPVGVHLRSALDYLRYLRPNYDQAPKLRQRAEKKAPAFVHAALRRRGMKSRAGLALLRWVVRCCDRALPTDPALDAFIRDRQPDLVIVTPLIETGSPQSAHLRSARALGVRTCLSVYSWDNLTNKGLIHDPLDLVTVWNPMMKHEAVSLHHVPASRVVVTGAAPYDHWFTWTPRTTRPVFCARTGLDADRPFIVYLCSSKFIAPEERLFVAKWIEQIRAASPTLRDVGVLIRPHPQNVAAWRGADLSALGNVVIWPAEGANPVDADSRADYFDSIYHGVAVVGINTSAQIESAVVGRGVYTILAPEFRDTQGGTLHFHHLTGVNGGLLQVAADFDEHVAQLEAGLADPEGAAVKGRRFVEAFVRPHGIASPATPRLVAALEQTAIQGTRRPHRGPWWAPFARPVLLPLARRLVAPEVAGAEASARRERSAHGQAGELGAKAPAFGPAASDPKKGLGPSAFERYQLVRAKLSRWCDSAEPGEVLSASEQELLSRLRPLWTAQPETIDVLRRHGSAITNVAWTDYEAPLPDFRARLEKDLGRLLTPDRRDVWVDEPAALGGFGLNGRVGRYNQDTLRFFRLLSFLKDAGVLSPFRRAAPRRTVWEIGGGWGGFAYHFKTICRDSSYLITGRAGMLLLSATYLTTLFPSANVRFYDPDVPTSFWENWHDVDFAFAPEEVVGRIPVNLVDLTVDVATLDRMTAERAATHVAYAHEAGSGYFLSLCTHPESDGGAETPLSAAIERFYWRHPMCAPRYMRRRFAAKKGNDANLQRRYFLGWRRLHI